MSDYLQRLLSRHFGEGSSVRPNANRYFSRGAEITAEASPAGFEAPAEIPSGGAPAEDGAAAPPLEEAASDPIEETSNPILPPRPREAQDTRRDAAPPEAREQPYGVHEERIGERPVARSDAPTSVTEAAAAAPTPGLRRRSARPASPTREAPVLDATREASGTQPVAPSGKANERRIPPAPPSVSGKSSAIGGANPLRPAAKSHTTATELIAPGAGKPPVDAIKTAAAGTAAAAAPQAAASVPQPARREPRAVDRRDPQATGRGEPAPRATAAAFDRGSEPAAAHAIASLPDTWTHESLLAPSAATPDEPPGALISTPIRPPLAPLPAASRSAAAATPEISVTIGSIELHAAAAVPAPAAAAPTPRGPRLSLDEYLERRGRRRS